MLSFPLRPKSKAVGVGAALPTINDSFAGEAPNLGALEYGRQEPHCGPCRITWQLSHRLGAIGWTADPLLASQDRKHGIVIRRVAALKIEVHCFHAYCPPIATIEDPVDAAALAVTRPPGRRRGFPRWRVSCLCRLTSMLKNRFWRGSGGRSNRHFGDETSAGWAEIASWHALQGALGRVSAPDFKRLACNHLPTALDFSVRFRYNAGCEPSPDPVARGARPTGASGRSAALE